MPPSIRLLHPRGVRLVGQKKGLVVHRRACRSWLGGPRPRLHMSRAGSNVRGEWGERIGVGGLYRVAEQDARDDGGRAFGPWAVRLRRSLRKSDDRVRRLSGRAVRGLVEWPSTSNDVADGRLE